MASDAWTTSGPPNATKATVPLGEVAFGVPQGWVSA